MAADIDRRYYVEQMYPGPTWKKRVANMPDNQVFAIYMREQKKVEAQLEEMKAAKKVVNQAATNDDIPF